MMGPSAPKGPPVPMLTTLETGFSRASRGATRLPFARMFSMASGMPWPRICSEPYRAIRPMTTPPATGIRTASRPGPSPGADRLVLRRPA